MADFGELLVGGQFQVTAGLPNGVPGPPPTVFGGSAAGPPVNGSAWIEGPMLLGSPIAYPLPRPSATFMLGRTQNYLAPELKALPILAITSRGFAPTPTDLLIGDPAGIVGISVNSSTITVTNKTTIGIFSKNLTGVIPKVNLVGKKLGIIAKTTVTGKTAITGITKIGPKLVVLGKLNVTGSLRVAGTISSPTIALLKAKIQTKKGFDIPHPSKSDHRLRYICVEGPAAEVYLRGKIKDNNVIELPDYWKDLVDIETIGVTLTPIEVYQELFVDKIEWGSRIIIKNNLGGPIHCDFVIFAERKDTAKNIAEYKGLTPNDYPGDNNEYTINGK
jgi:hypothetical protein